MRSLSKMSSEPNLYGSSKGGSPSSRSSNKSFGASIPARKSIASYKLSSKVRNILSKELGGSSSTGGGASANIYGYGNVTSDDSSLQSTNTARRKFQRRGSKAPSMFKAMSLSSLGLDETPEEGEPSQHQQQQQQQQVHAQQNVLQNSFVSMESMNHSHQMIPNDSCRSALTSLGESTTTFGSDCMEDSFNLGEFGGGRNDSM
jgi:hypothetical protein